ncbi:MAG: hypothetical protein P1U87_02725 [Verrucomicrobiales bacterium]|nr:hypothetical protein [Verrucomicrobiales bacterium]
MSFTSITFWSFFVLVFAIYRIVPFRIQNRLLLVASQIFYGWWDWRFLGLLWITIISDYLIGKALHGTRDKIARKRLMTLSLFVNLGILATFKYANFFSAEASDLLDWLGINHSVSILEIVLPIGISFYTFQSLSYVIDIYRKQLDPVNDLGDYALFVSFFPQLVAGPIERASRLLPQVTRPREALNTISFRDGLYLVLFGLFMKLVIADNLATIVDYCFSLAPDQMGRLDVLLGAYAFTFQIYGDFYGYSCIAQGLALWMGFKLMFNFRTPFFSGSVSEFWQRWHISLSSWLRDYVYYSFGGARSRWKPYRNLLVTMALAGLWHGANWTFVLWGSFFGVCMAIERLYQTIQGTRKASGHLWNAFKIFCTFHIIVFSMMIFRSQSLDQLVSFIQTLKVGGSANQNVLLYGSSLLAALCVPLLIYETWQYRSNDPLVLMKANWRLRVIFLLVMVLSLFFFRASSTVEFIYFQF